MKTEKLIQKMQDWINNIGEDTLITSRTFIDKLKKAVEEEELPVTICPLDKEEEK